MLRNGLVVTLSMFLFACGGASEEWTDVGHGDVPVAVDTTADARNADVAVDIADVGVSDVVSEDVASFDLASGDTADIVIDENWILLVDDGVSEHRILLSAESSPSEQRAADELQSYVLAVTGATLPILTEAPDDDEPLIVLGRGVAAAALGVDPSDEELGEQGYQWKTVPPHVVIAGTRGAGTMYGVHRFLEDVVGVRWLAPGVERVPERATLYVPPTDDVVQPAFWWRHTSYEWPGGDTAFWAHQGDNNGSRGPEAEYGLEHHHDGRAHSYFWYVSPGEFFDEHPEYFSEIGGVRQREETQLCLTNPDVLDIVAERMLQRMADNPDATQHNFSQKDYYNYCECEHCRAMNEQYGTAGGTQFWFVNQLAERTAELYPDKQIGTLAYMYTEEPPVDLEVHPNVAVWLCHMYPSCDSHPIRTCPLDADYKRRAMAWAGLVDHLYIWHYTVDFMHYYNPFPNLRAMVDDMRFYKEIGVEGIYLQGMGHDGGGGEFSLLRPYLGMKLLWDPEQDEDAVINDFLRGYYGDAWTPIRDWLDLIHDEVEDNNIHMHLYTNPAQGYLSDEIVWSGEDLFDEAEAMAVGDEELLDRVRVARMPLVYARIFPRNGYRIEDGRLHWEGQIASILEVNEFLSRLAAHGFKTVREAEGGAETMRLLYTYFAAPLDIHTIENEHLAVDVVSRVGGRALRIIDKASGECITAYNRTKSLFFPFCGGLEDRVGGIFRFFGWVEPAAIYVLEGRTAVVDFTTLDQLFDVHREMELDSEEPVLHVRTTVTNPSEGDRELQLHSHLELELGALETTRVRFTALDGTTVDEDMTEVIAGLREGKHFYDQKTPAGEWRFTGSKGLEVTHRFDNEEVEFSWLYAYPHTLQDLEVELWMPRVVLGPGESATFTRSLEVRAAR